jgi:hypothetical protein
MVSEPPGIKTGLRIGLLLLALALAPDAATGPAAAAESPEDAAYVAHRLQEILEFEKAGIEIPWKNPATNSTGMIKIDRTYYQKPKLPCRDYRRTQIMDDGLKLVVEGTGCRVGDARWFLNEKPPTVEGAAPVKAATPPPTPPTTSAPTASTPAAAPPAPSSPSPETPTKTPAKTPEAPKPAKKAESKPSPPKKPKKPEFTFQLPTRTAMPDGGAS